MPSLFTALEGGGARPWRIVHRGIEYQGEVVLADSWSQGLGEEIEKEDLHFRLVLLTREQAVAPESIRDRRIAVCVPAEADRTTRKLAREYLAIKERRAEYHTGADLEEGEGEIEAELLPMQLRRYGAGSVVSIGPLPLSLSGISNGYRVF